jgi:hypothetical protein
MLLPMSNVLYVYFSSFRSMCAVPSMAAFCSSLIACYVGMLLGYCLDDSETVSVAAVRGYYRYCFRFYISGALYFYNNHYYNYYYIVVIFPVAQKPVVGQDLPFTETSRHRHATLDRNLYE